MKKLVRLVPPVLTLSTALALGGAVAYAAPPDKSAHGPDGEHGKAHGPKPAAGEDRGPGRGQGPGQGPDKDKDQAKGGKPDHADKDQAEGDKPGHADKDDKHGDDDKHGHHRGPRAMHELLDELGSGKLKKEDLKGRLADLREGRDERVREHREELRAHFGSTLAQPAVREELEHHARRIARLNRALLVCETEVKKDKDKLKERISKLIARENDRHEKAMARFKSMPPAPSASAAAPAMSAAPAKAGE